MPHDYFKNLDTFITVLRHLLLIFCQIKFKENILFHIFSVLLMDNLRFQTMTVLSIPKTVTRVSHSQSLRKYTIPEPSLISIQMELTLKRSMYSALEQIMTKILRRVFLALHCITKVWISLPLSALVRQSGT